MENTLANNVKNIEVLRDREMILERISKVCETEPGMIELLKNIVGNIERVREDSNNDSRVLDVNLTYKDYKGNVKETYAKRFKNTEDGFDI